MGVDATQLRCLDHRADPAPGGGAFVVTGEQRVFPVRGDGADQILDIVAVHLDPAVGEEELEAVPVAGDVAELLAKQTRGLDANLNSSPNALTSRRPLLRTD